jgi:hypothetical protein
MASGSCILQVDVISAKKHGNVSDKEYHSRYKIAVFWIRRSTCLRHI